MRFLFSFILILGTTFATAQQSLHKEIWLDENKTAIKVNAISFDKRGYMIAGTDLGLYRFNGLNFTKLTQKETSPVTALYLTDNKLWVGYKNGRFGYLENDSVIISPLKSLLKDHEINCLYSASDQELWIGTNNGIFRLRGDHLQKFDVQNGLSDNYIYAIQQIEDYVFAATDQGVNQLHFKGKSLQVNVINTFDSLNDDIISALTVLPNHQLMMGTQKGFMGVYDHKSKQLNTIKSDKITWGQITSILPESEHTLLATTLDGKLLDLQWQSKDSLAIKVLSVGNKALHSLLEDESGNIWAATHTGLTMFTGNILKYISVPQPFNIAHVTAIAVDTVQQLWIAMGNSLYIHKNNNQLKLVHFFASSISSLHFDNKNALWVGTSANGVWLKQSAAQSFRQPLPKSANNYGVLNIATGNGSVWIAGLNGVNEYLLDYQYRVIETKEHNKEEGISSDYVYQMLVQKNGAVWLATDGAGISKYWNNGYQNWSNFENTNDAVIYTMAESPNGDVWAGTMANSIFRFKNNRWQNVTDSKQNNADHSIVGMLVTASGHLVCSYQKCIDIWYPQNLTVRHFNARQNLGIDSLSGMLNCTAKDIYGSVYIPFQKGILVFAKQNSKISVQPRVVINRINVNNTAINLVQKEFKANEHFFTFMFEGISFANPENLNYRYRLEGYSNNWIYTKDPEATFSRLPWGNYVFKVQASLNGNFDQAKEDIYSFKIITPFYFRIWFIAFSILILTGLVVAIIKYRDSRVKKVALLKEDKLRFEFEYLKSQVNPHFLFNSLNTLTGLIEEDQENAIRYTERLSDLYRHSLQSYQQDKATLKEELELLQSYIYIQEARFGKALQVSINIDEVTINSYFLPAMTLQLVVENAIKHNVIAQSNPLQLTVYQKGDVLFVENRINLKITRQEPSGIGLKNINSRYKMLIGKNIEFGARDGYWIVELPLLK